MKPFELHVDLADRRLDVVKRGFWDDAIFEAYRTELTAALRALQSQGGCVIAMVDATQFKVQSRAIMLRIKEMLDELGPLCARRTATLIPAELNRMQAQLAGDAICNRTFADREEAEAWLAQDGSERWLRRAAQG